MNQIAVVVITTNIVSRSVVGNIPGLKLKISQKSSTLPPQRKILCDVVYETNVIVLARIRTGSVIGRRAKGGRPEGTPHPHG